MKWLRTLAVAVLGLSLVPAFAFAQTSGCAPTNVASDVQLGSSGTDVIALQNFLIGHGYSISSASGYFGNETLAAVKQFQTDYSISPVSGYVGPITRMVIAHFGCNTSSQQSLHTIQAPAQQVSQAIPGDMNGDGVVNATDMTLFNQIPAGTKIGSVSYNPKADFNKDGVIDFKDLLILSQHYTPSSQTGSAGTASNQNANQINQIDNTANILKAFQSFYNSVTGR